MRTEAPYEELRPLLFSIAYRMIGSVGEAEDIVQEAFLRIHRAETQGTTIDSPKAYLSAVTTRLGIDHLKSARVRREQYVGEWLPEPLLTDEGSPDAAAHAETADSLSTAFLVLLESLTPVERAVFLLREVFDYEYGEIARIVGKEEAACRQLFSRAKKHIAEHRPRFEASPEEHRQILNRFLGAVSAGDMDGLMSLLAEDVTWWADGGGKVTAARRPFVGREMVAKVFMRLPRAAPENQTADIEEINGKPALIFRVDGRVMAVLTFDVGGGLIRAVRFIVNPDKLKHL